MKAIKFSKIKEGDVLFVVGKDGAFEGTFRGTVTQINRSVSPDGWTEITLDDAYGFELYTNEHVVILLDRPKATT